MKHLYPMGYHTSPYWQPTPIIYNWSYPPQFRAYSYPEVNPDLFNQSAIAMQKLMKEASLVLKKIADSKQFAMKLMSAAQESNLAQVDELIKSTGISSKVDTSYTPDGIKLKLSSKAGDTDCCHLTISMRWRQS
ncbi:hypothetical protein EJF36_16925 [Bacillus sp. HMF5848]|uniref:hypothetical protein n=1 Tax=Bacillus sp. HMF5848 TaxID=2495421 RepID=UPI000F78A6CF|nr:hypothetical protein [Bacillus sp. HMF5848]RSK28414.1 hypothetical protein EJF36_16925 [Bacillus sp. HMF5848]